MARCHSGDGKLFSQLTYRYRFLPLVSALFVALLILPIPLVLAVPVDPTWIPGLYDNGDHDEVVDTLLSAEAVPVSLRLVAGSIRADGPVLIAVERESITCSFGVVTQRAPPLS